MEVRIVGAARGWQWIVDGFALFRRSPAVWIALTLMLALLWAGSLMIQVLGPLLFNLFSPLFFAGLMIGCRALERGEDLDIRHLFAGFQQQAAAQVTIGGVYLAGSIVAFGIALQFIDDSKLAALMPKSGANPEQVRAAARELAHALAIGAVALMPVLMLVWYAPLLIVFDGLAPLQALKLSFAACFVNVLPFLVYGVAILLIWFALSMPAVIGAVGVILALALLFASLPVLFCSIYASYKDIFVGGGAAGGAARPSL